MTMKSANDNPILVTGAAGDIGAIGRSLTAMLLAQRHKVRALVRREDERSEGLRRLGAEVVQGDLTDLTSMHRADEPTPPANTPRPAQSPSPMTAPASQDL